MIQTILKMIPGHSFVHGEKLNGGVEVCVRFDNGKRLTLAVSRNRQEPVVFLKVLIRHETTEEFCSGSIAEIILTPSEIHFLGALLREELKARSTHLRVDIALRSDDLESFLLEKANARFVRSVADLRSGRVEETTCQLSLSELH